MKSWLTGLMLLAAAGVTAWWMIGRQQPLPAPAPAASGAAKQEGAASAASPPRATVTTAAASAMASGTAEFAASSLHKEFAHAKDYFAFFKSLEGRTDAEALFYKASILDRCKRWSGNAKRDTPEERIQRFNESLTGPHREIRKAIHAKLIAEGPVTRCANFSQAISEADVDVAYDAAAKAGDIRGQLDRLHRSLLAGATSSTVPAVGVPFASDAKVTMVTPSGPTEADVALLKQALASRDPVQIEAAGPLLSAEYSNFELKFGDGNGLVGIPDYFLWKSVACHYAGGCGSDSFFVQQNCSVNGRCDVSTYDELLQRYIFKEADWQNFQRYRATLVNAIDTQDWSMLQERRGPRTNLWRNQIITGDRSPRFNLRYY